MLDEASKSLLAGTSYEALELLGSGGMGKVFLARHIHLNTRVCVKILHAADTEDALRRFQLEARALAALAGGVHENLVHVRDFGVTATGKPFLVMEHLEGRTLAQERSARGEIPWTEAVEWTIQALEGMVVAHRAGMVHRDIKPPNLFLCAPTSTRSATVKVLDFGIVKIVSKDGPVEANAMPTAAGHLMGTPRYVSPDVIRQEPLDARADLYSLGLVLWELITGRLPYFAHRKVEVIITAHILETLPAPSSITKQKIPSALERVIARAIEKDRNDRFPCAEEFQAALRGVLEGPRPIEELAFQDTVPLPPVEPTRVPKPVASAPATVLIENPLAAGPKKPKPRTEKMVAKPNQRTVPLVAEELQRQAEEDALAGPTLRDVPSPMHELAEATAQPPTVDPVTVPMRSRATWNLSRFILTTLLSTLVFGAVVYWLLGRWLG